MYFATHLITDSNILKPTFLLNYTLRSTSTGVCITCTFLESSTTDCVAVVHQRISQLNSSGLMNIESSHKFTRSGDTASGCIEGVNLEDYQIGVVGLQSHILVTNTGGWTSIIWTQRNYCALFQNRALCNGALLE